MLPAWAAPGAAAGRGGRLEEHTQPYEILILVCTNLREEGRDACGARNSEALHQALKAVVEQRLLKGRVRVSRTGCLGQCSVGPNVMVFPEGVWYSRVSIADVPALIARHLEG
jgi:(2Fe-2S) ferredoxin